jgi:hypothetical protein
MVIMPIDPQQAQGVIAGLVRRAHDHELINTSYQAADAEQRGSTDRHGWHSRAGGERQLEEGDERPPELHSVGRLAHPPCD